MEPLMLPPLPAYPEAVTIPKILHQVWVGGPPPAWVKHMWAVWDDFLSQDATWEVMRWTDENSPPLGVDLLPPRGMADLVRVWMVNAHGGIYTDSDALPLRSLRPFVGRRPGWVGTTPEMQGAVVLGNGFFGFPIGHRFLSEVWAVADDALERGVRNEHFVAGPRTFANVAQRIPIEVDWTFPSTQRPDLQKAMIQTEPFDLAALRDDWPDAHAVHITYFGRDKAVASL